MELKRSYIEKPDKIIQTRNREISVFKVNGDNIHKKVVEEFGEEWLKFNDFSDKSIKVAGDEYFDIINEEMVNKQTYALDIGCGTGRWTKYLADKAGFIEAVDPSDAIFSADKLLGNIKNVRLTKASVQTLPFQDESFDFAMSIGVLHHIPDTKMAMVDCVKKIKRGGYFYVYLYYNLEKRGWFFTAIFKVSDVIRLLISRLPGSLKKMLCDVLAIVVYMPLILFARLLHRIGFPSLAKKMPLGSYYNKSFFMIRNDALDRFGTRLEQRFSSKQIIEMMEHAGLTNIVMAPGIPYYHTVGRKI